VTLQVEPAAFVERTLTVAPRFVDPPASARPRIEREAKRLHAIYETVSADRTPGPFVAPVPQRRSSPFGARSIFNGVPRERHGGLDFASPAGTVIRAPAAGKVVLVAPLYFTGNTVVIDHGRGLYSVLAHLQRATVRQGQVVLQGARLGTVGMTGRATGPHLHWTVRLGGTRIDPAAVLDVLGPATPRP
jgi:murein DD-endopeptidase MepM/ murein hydrolase activator NlpD